ncbi:MAG: peptide chain release factor N(5)-glutamine methyltransferase [Proteobacteria bacterium]|jgi:release factor glutamine methyltransferase|nr:peptide chain release factor N(5)-glutamine methyltransferase [Desulfocapsa sp.]MBU3945628.1 peptide chain release factor N(5)-glutamine methyltransferase [Pseudomonadota bacterium]MCG2745873.1 peptide chain release factor N(5)-glutamine methyltransferase [Desulfobacteraceae bacterium]MBU3984094.1 peptide chain release factor N(5)-glutamine methyltransferase [Pseudomonadota bacterium]MBU4029670.1 peptide chain release factor N(5)-glutamine methyltransferase [Pseudomonadota bacterium]
MRVVDLLHYGATQLESAGVEQASLEVELLLGFCLEKNRTGLFLAATDEVDERHEQQFLSLLARRSKYEPSAYILGEKEFWSLPFLVTPDVLIPRPETEFLLETVLALNKNEQWQPDLVLDLCCGSGVIAIILALETGRSVTAVDISAPALQVARRNAIRHQVADRLALVQADLFSAFSPRHIFGLVVSNPPYVSRQELRDRLQPEVMHFEPHLALDGGVDGLDIIQRIRMTLPRVLKPGGDFFMEIGADQGLAVMQLFSGDDTGEKIFERVEVLQDYSGRDRVLHARMAT